MVRPSKMTALVVLFAFSVTNAKREIDEAKHQDMLVADSDSDVPPQTPLLNAALVPPPPFLNTEVAPPSPFQDDAPAPPPALPNIAPAPPPVKQERQNTMSATQVAASKEKQDSKLPSLIEKVVVTDTGSEEEEEPQEKVIVTDTGSEEEEELQAANLQLEAEALVSAFEVEAVGAKRKYSSLLPNLPTPTLTLGLKKVDDVDAALKDIDLEHLSHVHPVDPGLLAAGTYPEGSEEYAFAFPNNALPNGAFIYYQHDEIFAINKIVEAGKGDSDVSFEAKWTGTAEGGVDCPEGTHGYHPTTMFEDTSEFCWMPQCKVMENKLLQADALQDTLGCFMYKMKAGSPPNRAYVTKSVAKSWLGGAIKAFGDTLKGAPTLKILPTPQMSMGLMDVKDLDTELGDLSETHDVEEKQIAGLKDRLQVEKDPKEYAWAYPTEDLPHGGFVYYDADNKLISIQAVGSAGTGITDLLHFDKVRASDVKFESKATGNVTDLKAEVDCPSDKQTGYHNMTLFEDVEKYCWMPECKIVNDTKMGCFMFRMANTSEYRAYLTTQTIAENSALRPPAGIVALMAMLITQFQ